MFSEERFMHFVEYVRTNSLELTALCDNAIDGSVKKSGDLAGTARDNVEREAGDEIAHDLSLVAQALFNSRRNGNLNGQANSLFMDPAMDIMLDLYLAHAAQKYVSVTSAGLATNAPQTTALRHIWHLESLSLVERTVDPKDKRRHFVGLTNAGIALIEQNLRGYEHQFRKLFGRPQLA